MTPQGHSAVVQNTHMVELTASGDADQVEARLREALDAHGLQLFARIDHAAGAAEAGLPLRPTELLIFGNAKGGTPLMQAGQAAGIDLPLKVLVWQDADGKVWLSYNEPSWIAQRHGRGAASEGTVHALTAAISALAKKAAD